jgi:hypothetical protein
MDSPYPRVSGTGLDSANVSSFSFDPAQIDSAGVKINFTLPTGKISGASNKYIRLVGTNTSGAVVVGYAYIPAGSTSAGLGAVTFGDERDDTGADVTYSRVLFACCHDYATASGAGPGGAEGDLSHVDITVTTGSGVFKTDGAGTPTCGELYCTASGVGQVFVPCFYKQADVDTTAEALVLPVLNPSPSGQNSYQDEEAAWQAIWIRRKVLQNASAASGITNVVQIYGDSA